MTRRTRALRTVALALMSLFAIFHIELTARVLGVLLVSEVVLAVFAAGMVMAFVLRSRYPERYARIGSFEVADSADTPQGAAV